MVERGPFRRTHSDRFARSARGAAPGAPAEATGGWPRAREDPPRARRTSWRRFGGAAREVFRAYFAEAVPCRVPCHAL